VVLITASLFVKKSELTTEQATLEEELRRSENPDAGLLNLARKTLDFQAGVIYWFQKGSPQVKRLILKIIGSNLCLKDRKLLLDFKKPFFAIAEAKDYLDGQNHLLEPMEKVENKGEKTENELVCPVTSGRLDAIRTAFQFLPNPTELETQLDLLHDLCTQNEAL